MELLPWPLKWQYECSKCTKALPDWAAPTLSLLKQDHFADDAYEDCLAEYIFSRKEFIKSGQAGNYDEDPIACGLVRTTVHCQVCQRDVPDTLTSAHLKRIHRVTWPAIKDEQPASVSASKLQAVAGSHSVFATDVMETEELVPVPANPKFPQVSQCVTVVTSVEHGEDYQQKGPLECVSSVESQAEMNLGGLVTTATIVYRMANAMEVDGKPQPETDEVYYSQNNEVLASTSVNIMSENSHMHYTFVPELVSARIGATMDVDERSFLSCTGFLPVEETGNVVQVQASCSGTQRTSHDLPLVNCGELASQPIISPTVTKTEKLNVEFEDDPPFSPQLYIEDYSEEEVQNEISASTSSCPSSTNETTSLIPGTGTGLYEEADRHSWIAAIAKKAETKIDVSDTSSFSVTSPAAQTVESLSMDRGESVSCEIVAEAESCCIVRPIEVQDHLTSIPKCGVDDMKLLESKSANGSDDLVPDGEMDGIHNPGIMPVMNATCEPALIMNMDAVAEAGDKGTVLGDGRHSSPTSPAYVFLDHIINEDMVPCPEKPILGDSSQLQKSISHFVAANNPKEKRRPKKQKRTVTAVSGSSSTYICTCGETAATIDGFITHYERHSLVPKKNSVFICRHTLCEYQALNPQDFMYHSARHVVVKQVHRYKNS